MATIEEKLIRLTQAGLPLVERPYLWIAEKLDVSEAEILKLIDKMKSEKKIRRVGAVPNHYALGYKFNLMTVWDVDDKQADELGQKVGNLDFVSHCYLRPRHLPDWPYNLFAMIHARNEAMAEERRRTIENLLDNHCRRSDALVSERILKKTGLRIQ